VGNKEMVGCCSLCWVFNSALCLQRYADTRVDSQFGGFVEFVRSLGY